MKLVRDGQKVWPYCSNCDCRLDFEEVGVHEYRVAHFGMHPEKDARGHRCSDRYKAWLLPKYKLHHIVGV